jgi:hypothetical protein
MLFTTSRIIAKVNKTYSNYKSSQKSDTHDSLLQLLI